MQRQSSYGPDKLQLMLQKDPTTDFVDLSSREIYDLSLFMPVLEGFSNLQQLYLKNNKLSFLPENMSRLTQVAVINLVNNPLDVNGVVEGLKSMPKLAEVYIDTTQEEEEYLRNQLRDVAIYKEYSDEASNFQENHQMVDEEDHARDANNAPFLDPKKQEIDIKQEELEQVAATFDQIRELYIENNPNVDKKLASEFEKHLKSIMVDLADKLSQNLPEQIVNTHILKAKFALYEICFAKIIDFIANADPAIAQILQTLHDSHALIFKDLSQIIVNQPANVKLNYEPDYQMIRDENDHLRQQLREMQGENKKYLDQIIKHSKGIRQDPSSILGNIQNNQNNQDNYSKMKINESPKQRRQISNAFTSGNKSPIIGSSSPARFLTIRQLKEVIEEIYKSKETFDKKYQEAQLSRETMEQHKLSYLNQKYGLKSLIGEWDIAIMNGIKKFSSDDNDITVFAKILNNECDEEFRFVQNQVKNTIQELLKMYLRGRYPYKHSTEIKEMVAQKIVGQVYEDEAVDIIKYMYNSEDSEQLIQKLNSYYTQSSKNNSNHLENLKKKKITREQYNVLVSDKDKPRLDFVVFQKIILDFQLWSHEKFLKKFIKAFRSEDRDSNGVIDEYEFKNLCGKMEIRFDKHEIQKFLEKVDPYNQKKITFSQCVTLFSSEVIDSPKGEKLSILQILSDLA